MSVALLCFFLRRPKCSNCVVSAVCEVFYVFFFATDQAKQKQGMNPRCQYVFFFESKCMKRRRLKSMSQNGFWNIKICKYSGKTQTKQVR